MTSSLARTWCPQGLPRPSSCLTSGPWMTQVIPRASHSVGCREGSSGRRGAAIFLRWRGDWEFKEREDSLALSQGQLLRKHTAATQAAFPGWGGLQVPGPAEGDTFSLPTHSCSTQNTELPWHGLACGLPGPRSHTVPICNPEQVPSPCCRGRPRAVELWASDSTSLSLSFLICKNGGQQ